MIERKLCRNVKCEVIFKREEYDGDKRWEIRKFCSKRCSSLFNSELAKEVMKRTYKKRMKVKKEILKEWGVI